MTELELTFEWQHLGDLSLDGSGRIVFPKATLRPGLYRFDVESQSGCQSYVGETDQLDRRFQHYRTPEPTQATNIRLNRTISDSLREGGTVRLSILEEPARLFLNGKSVAPDLRAKAVRVLFECASLIDLTGSSCTILNARS